MAQTKIRIDEFGRRRVDHSKSSSESVPQSVTDARELRQDSKDPAQANEIAQLKAANIALAQKLEAFMSFVNNSTICGQGFSGTIASGISFDINAVQLSYPGTPTPLDLCDGTIVTVPVLFKQDPP